MSSYEIALARMYALGHELAQTPSHKFDLAHSGSCWLRWTIRNGVFPAC